MRPADTEISNVAPAFGAKSLLLRLSAFLISLSSPLCRGQEPASVASALSRANALATQQQFEAALAAYRDADTLSGHTCADCYLHIANAELMLGDLSGAEADCARAAKAAGDDRVLEADAHVLRGQILEAMAGESSDSKIAEAEREFRAAIAASSKNSKARFALALLLLGQGRDADGVAELKAYISGPFANPRYVDRAKRLIADPTRARAPASDNFSFKTIEGETVSKESLHGKVALLDFWGTWCPPCRASVPILQEVHEKFAGKAFQLVGISSDQDESAWRNFIASHHMNWSEFIDLDGQVQSIFEINAFPTFIVLDRDGGIEFRESGVGAATQNELEAAINSALRKPVSTKPPLTSAGTQVSPAAPTVAAPTPTLGDESAPALSQWQPKFLPIGAALFADASSIAAPTHAQSGRFDLPSDDVENGDAEGNVYRNDFLGLSYRFPQSWIPASLDELEQLNATTLGWMNDHASAQPVRVACPKTIFQAKVDSRSRAPFVRITVQLSNSLTLESLRNDAGSLKDSTGVIILASVQQLAAGKRTFFRTDYQLPLTDPPTWMATIDSQAGPYRITLEIWARSKEELESLAATAQSLSISKP